MGDGDRSLEVITTRASMRIRTAQAGKTAPVVLISVVALLVAMQGKVNGTSLYWWCGLMSASTLARTVLCYVLRSRVETAGSADLIRYERYLFTSAVANAIVIGASFYLIARTGDLTVRLVVTLLSCFYGIGT